MKLAGRISGTVKVAIADGFSVDLAFLSRRANQDLVESCTSQEFVRGEIVPRLDALKLSRERLRKLLPTATGLTPDVLLDLIEWRDSDRELDVPDLDENGCIPWDHDHVALRDTTGTGKDAKVVEYTVPMLLWAYSRPDRFAQVIEAAHEKWLELYEQAQKKRLMISENSAG